MICGGWGFFRQLADCCSRFPRAQALFGTQFLRLSIGYKTAQYHSQRIFRMSLTIQTTRRFVLKLLQDLGDGQGLGRFPQESVAQGSKCEMSAGTTIRLNRLKVQQCFLDHTRAEQIGKADYGLLDYSNAFDDGGSLMRENSQSVLQFADNRLQVLVLG